MCGMLLYEVATLQISFSKRNEASFFVNLSCLLPPIESPILVESLKIKIFVRTHWKADYNFLIHQQRLHSWNLLCTVLEAPRIRVPLTASIVISVYSFSPQPIKNVAIFHHSSCPKTYSYQYDLKH